MIDKLERLDIFHLSTYVVYAQAAVSVLGSGQPPHKMDAMLNSLAHGLNLEEDMLEVSEHVANSISLGMCSPYAEVGVYARSFMGDTLDNLIRIYSSVLNKKDITHVHNLGLNMGIKHTQTRAARRLVDALLYTYITSEESLGGNSENCIGFPGMPNMHPLIAQAIDVAQQNLFHKGNWISDLRLVNEQPFIYMCPPDMSDTMKCIVPLDVGTIYLSARPTRGESRSNHLRSL